MDTNDWQPLYEVDQIKEILNQAGRPISQALILIIGVAYKPDVADVRNAPALLVIERLQKAGARVMYHDPYVSTIEVVGNKLRSVDLSKRLLQGVDLAVLVTAHSSVDVDHIYRLVPRFLDLTHGA